MSLMDFASINFIPRLMACCYATFEGSLFDTCSLAVSSSRRREVIRRVQTDIDSIQYTCIIMLYTRYASSIAERRLAV